jgi:hypothetical protein
MGQISLTMLKSDDPTGYREIPARPKSSGANTANKLRSPPVASPIVPRRELGIHKLVSSFHFLSFTMISRLILVVASALALSSGLASAHGSHSNDGQPPSNDWATRHMMGKCGRQHSKELIGSREF